VWQESHDYRLTVRPGETHHAAQIPMPRGRHTVEHPGARGGGDSSGCADAGAGGGAGALRMLRPYQVDLERDIYAEWATHRNVLAVAPTGSGKAK